jgi:hypothetical protein
MIAHAAQLYRTQFGKAPTSLEVLTQTGCAPGAFNQGPLTSPFGGTYALSADGVYGICSVLGSADHLTPCCDVPMPGASAEEAAGYREFAKTIGPDHWLWHLPAAVRIRNDPHHVRAEAVFVPPTGSRVHASLKQFLGGDPEPLNPLPVVRRSVASVSVRLNPQFGWRTHNSGRRSQDNLTVGSQLGVALVTALPGALPWPAFVVMPKSEPLAPRPVSPGGLEAIGIGTARWNSLLERGIGNQAALHICDRMTSFPLHLPAVAEWLAAVKHRDSDAFEQCQEWCLLAARFSIPACVAIPVKDAAMVDAFLADLDTGLARNVPTWRDNVAGARGHAQFYQLTTTAGLALRSLSVRAGPASYRLFWARIGDGLYIANQPDILDDLHSAGGPQVHSATSERGPVGHAMVRIRPDDWARAQPELRLGWEEANREACMRNLNLLSAAARAFSFTPPVSGAAFDQETRAGLVLKYAGQMHGCDFTCPDGGRYTLAEDGKTFVCSVHGSAAHPRQPDHPLASNPAARLTDATMTLTLTPEGWRMVLTLSRK